MGGYFSFHLLLERRADGGEPEFSLLGFSKEGNTPGQRGGARVPSRGETPGLAAGGGPR